MNLSLNAFCVCLTNSFATSKLFEIFLVIPTVVFHVIVPSAHWRTLVLWILRAASEKQVFNPELARGTSSEEYVATMVPG
jgi:hypothetical protein